MAKCSIGRNRMNNNYRRSQSPLIKMSANKTDLSQSQNNVLDLPKHKINWYECSALSKGMEFIPNLRKYNITKVVLIVLMS